MADLIFISFSKEYAGKVALELQSLIRNIFGESIETFTSQNIVSGDWSEEIHEKISQSKYAISVLSPENMKNAPWLISECNKSRPPHPQCASSAKTDIPFSGAAILTITHQLDAFFLVAVNFWATLSESNPTSKNAKRSLTCFFPTLKHEN